VLTSLLDEIEKEGARAWDIYISPRPAKNIQFDAKKFLANIGQGRKPVHVRQKEQVYTQGDPCDAIFYIQKGKIKLTDSADQLRAESLQEPGG
jgi:CRP-like cAMP-binding protein